MPSYKKLIDTEYNALETPVYSHLPLPAQAGVTGKQRTTNCTYAYYETKRYGKYTSYWEQYSDSLGSLHR
jgi:hypothetical protein